jgi:AcrR family transcriptional regulator
MTKPMENAGVPASRPMRADARRNRERLLAAAKEIFAERGADASLDEIARRAGVGPGTLYRHFPTREALQEAVYRDSVEALYGEAVHLLETCSPADALAGWARAVLAHSAENRGLLQTLKAVIDRNSEVFAACRDTLRAAADAIMTRAQEAGDARPDATGPDLVRLVHGVSLATERSPEDADRLIDIVLDGLRPQGGVSAGGVPAGGVSAETGSQHQRA